MEEQEYIELQTLLAKLRVECLKNIGKTEISTKVREQQYKLVRSIDNIARRTPLKIEEGTISII